MRRVTATFPTIKVFGMALKGGLVQRVCTSPLLSIEPYTWIARIFSAIHCILKQLLAAPIVNAYGYRMME